VHVFSDVDFVDDQQVGFGDARAAFAGLKVAERLSPPDSTSTSSNLGENTRKKHSSHH